METGANFVESAWNGVRGWRREFGAFTNLSLQLNVAVWPIGS